MAEDKLKKADFSGEETDAQIDYSSLSNVAKDSNSDDLKRLANASYLKLSFVRNSIALKNHIAYIPLALTIVTMILITWALRDHNEASSVIKNNTISFWFFVDVLASILTTLCYLNSQAKHASKAKKYTMLGLFLVLLIGELFIEYYIVHDYTIELNLHSSPIYKPLTVYWIKESAKWLNIHIVFIYITIAAAVAEPLLQPLCSKIRIKL
jgi:hypothetical protein